jgi:hypothetical protein
VPTALVESSRASHFAATDSICWCRGRESGRGQRVLTRVRTHQSDWCHWCGLATISSLTYLALSLSMTTEILAPVVTDCARLALVVAMSYLTPTVTDPRVVVMTMQLANGTPNRLDV